MKNTLINFIHYNKNKENKKVIEGIWNFPPEKRTKILQNARNKLQWNNYKIGDKVNINEVNSSYYGRGFIADIIKDYGICVNIDNSYVWITNENALK